MTISMDAWSCPLRLRDHPNIVLGHGGGGKLSSELIEHLFLPTFDSDELSELADAAVLAPAEGRLAVSTDSFVVHPLRFPGGDIGELAVNGTVNDLAMRGAVPAHLTAGFILEEGLALEELAGIATSMAAAAKRAGVVIVSADTKVVERGHGDGVYINTTGIGYVPTGVDIHPRRAQPGDAVVLSGTIGDHGMAIMSVRESLGFEADIASDTAPLNGLVADLLAAEIDVHVLRDPTRGGVAAAVNEIAGTAGVGIALDEQAIPIRPVVNAACELLGMDPLHVANEGKLVAIVPPDAAETTVEILRRSTAGRDAAVVGEVVSSHAGMVIARTPFGTSRVVDTMVGEQLPRIC